MKPRPGGVRSRLARSTALLAFCLVVCYRLFSMPPLRATVESPGPSPFAAAGQHRVAPLPGRLGSDEEHWSAPRGDAPASQAAEWEPGGPADSPAEQQQQQQQQHDEHDSHHGMEGGHNSDLPPAVQAQQPKEQGAAADDAAQAAGAEQVQQQQAPTQEQEQPVQPQTAAEQPGERQAGGLAGTIPPPQAEQPAEQQQQQQQQQASGTPSAGQQQQQQQQAQLRCAVINNVSTHLDVAAGVAWALQEAGCSVTCYLHHATQGIQDVMSQWYRGRYSPMEAILRDASQYDLLVVATMSLPPAPAVAAHKEIMLGQRHLPPPPHQRVALVVHNPDHLLVGLPLWLPGMLLSQAVRLGDGPPVAPSTAGRARHAAAGVLQRRARGGGSSRRLAAAPITAPSGGREAGPPLPPRLQLLALSPNVATYTCSLVETWAGNVLGPASQARVPVPWLPPLVPWQSTAAEPAAAATNVQAAAAADAHTALVGLGAGGPNRPMRHLCIQGAIDPRRRDYDSFFEAASHPAVLVQLKARGERLLLVGHVPKDGLPPMPEHLHGYVEVAADLIFELYYNTLASCRAILTAFGSDGYVLNKTSSTIAAAIHLEVPLLTEERVLDAYPFLDRAAAFIYDSGLAAPNVAKLARAAARRGMPAALARAIRMSMAADSGRRRRLWTEGAAEAVAAAAAEGTELAAEAGGSDDSGGIKQGDVQQQQQQQQQQQTEHAAAASGDAPDSLAAGSAAASSAGIEPPPPGSYAAALLAAFDDDAVRAARRAARQLKAQLMRHNLEVAGALLAETAAAAAALAA